MRLFPIKTIAKSKTMPSSISKIDVHSCLSALPFLLLFGMLITQHFKINRLVKALKNFPDKKEINEIKMSIIDHKFQTMEDFDELHRMLRNETNIAQNLFPKSN